MCQGKTHISLPILNDKKMANDNPKPKKCLNCGKVISHNYNYCVNKYFCNRRCYSEWLSHNHKIICKRCGKKFKKGGKRIKLCPECRSEIKRQGGKKGKKKDDVHDFKGGNRYFREKKNKLGRNKSSYNL